MMYSRARAFEISSLNFLVLSVVPSMSLSKMLFSSTMLSATSPKPSPLALFTKAESDVFSLIKSDEKPLKINGASPGKSKFMVYTLLFTK